MPVFETYAPGTFCWIDCGSADHRAARTFYGSLFGWTAEDHATPGGGSYTMYRKDGHAVAGGYQLTPEMQALGVASHWMSYVAVEDTAAVLRAVAAAGGRVMGPPIPVPGLGVMGIFSDPTGAACGTWEAGGHVGAGLANEPGTLVWNEVLTDDPASAGDFYTEVFGWDLETREKPAGPYHLFKAGDEYRAGMLAITPDMGDFPPVWTPYLAVAEIGAAVSDARRLGGTVEGDVMDVTGVGRMAVTADPAGAYFMMMEDAGS